MVLLQKSHVALDPEEPTGVGEDEILTNALSPASCLLINLHALYVYYFRDFGHDLGHDWGHEF